LVKLLIISAVVFSFVLLLGGQVSFVPDAEAIKSSGNRLTVISSNQVCGIELCDEPMSIEEKIQLFLNPQTVQETSFRPGTVLQQGVPGTGEPIPNPDTSGIPVIETEPLQDGGYKNYLEDGSLVEYDAAGNPVHAVTADGILLVYDENQNPTIVVQSNAESVVPSADELVALEPGSLDMTVDLYGIGESETYLDEEGNEVTPNPDGTSTVKYKDGSVFTFNLDGSATGVDKDGAKIQQFANGTLAYEWQDGSTGVKKPDGSWTKIHSDGRVETGFDPDVSQTDDSETGETIGSSVPSEPVPESEPDTPSKVNDSTLEQSSDEHVSLIPKSSYTELVFRTITIDGVVITIGDDPFHAILEVGDVYFVVLIDVPDIHVVDTNSESPIDDVIPANVLDGLLPELKIITDPLFDETPNSLSYDTIILGDLGLELDAGSYLIQVPGIGPDGIELVFPFPISALFPDSVSIEGSDLSACADDGSDLLCVKELERSELEAQAEAADKVLEPEYDFSEQVGDFNEPIGAAGPVGEEGEEGILGPQGLVVSENEEEWQNFIRSLNDDIQVSVDYTPPGISNIPDMDSPEEYVLSDSTLITIHPPGSGGLRGGGIIIENPDNTKIITELEKYTLDYTITILDSDDNEQLKIIQNFYENEPSSRNFVVHEDDGTENRIHSYYHLNEGSYSLTSTSSIDTMGIETYTQYDTYTGIAISTVITTPLDSGNTEVKTIDLKNNLEFIQISDDGGREIHREGTHIVSSDPGSTVTYTTDDNGNKVRTFDTGNDGLPDRIDTTLQNGSILTELQWWEGSDTPFSTTTTFTDDLPRHQTITKFDGTKTFSRIVWNEESGNIHMISIVQETYQNNELIETKTLTPTEYAEYSRFQPNNSDQITELITYQGTFDDEGNPIPHETTRFTYDGFGDVDTTSVTVHDLDGSEIGTTTYDASGSAIQITENTSTTSDAGAAGPEGIPGLSSIDSSALDGTPLAEQLAKGGKIVRISDGYITVETPDPNDPRIPFQSQFGIDGQLPEYDFSEQVGDFNEPIGSAGPVGEEGEEGPEGMKIEDADEAPAVFNYSINSVDEVIDTTYPTFHGYGQPNQPVTISFFHSEGKVTHIPLVTDENGDWGINEDGEMEISFPPGHYEVTIVFASGENLDTIKKPLEFTISDIAPELDTETQIDIMILEEDESAMTEAESENKVQDVESATERSIEDLDESLPGLEDYLEDLDESLPESQPKTVTFPNGTETTTFDSGFKITTFLDGTETITLRDGTKTKTHLNGTKTTTFPNDLKITTYLGGGKIITLPSGFSAPTTPGGYTTITLPNDTIVEISPNATITEISSDGTKTTTLRDGTKTTTIPDELPSNEDGLLSETQGREISLGLSIVTSDDIIENPFFTSEPTTHAEQAIQSLLTETFPEHQNTQGTGTPFTEYIDDRFALTFDESGINTGFIIDGKIYATWEVVPNPYGYGLGTYEIIFEDGNFKINIIFEGDGTPLSAEILQDTSLDVSLDDIFPIDDANSVIDDMEHMRDFPSPDQEPSTQESPTAGIEPEELGGGMYLEDTKGESLIHVPYIESCPGGDCAEVPSLLESCLGGDCAEVPSLLESCPGGDCADGPLLFGTCPGGDCCKDFASLFPKCLVLDFEGLESPQTIDEFYDSPTSSSDDERAFQNVWQHQNLTPPDPLPEPPGQTTVKSSDGKTIIYNPDGIALEVIIPETGTFIHYTYGDDHQAINAQLSIRSERYITTIELPLDENGVPTSSGSSTQPLMGPVGPPGPYLQELHNENIAILEGLFGGCTQSGVESVVPDLQGIVVRC